MQGAKYSLEPMIKNHQMYMKPLFSEGRKRQFHESNNR